MPIFKYRVRTNRGNELEGSIEAADRRVVIDKMREQSLIIMTLEEEIKSPIRIIYEKINAVMNQIKLKDIALFSRQLAVLVSAGVPIVQCLEILSGQLENKFLSDIVKRIKEDIETGVSITEAMEKHPNAFSELYVSMINAGEVGGILDIILDRIANYLESMQALKSKVKSAMAYPAVVLFIAMTVTFFIMTFVVPKFTEMFVSAGGSLPAPTAVLISISGFLKRYFILIILGLIGAGAAFKAYIKTDQGRYNIDSKVLKLPVFGDLATKVSVAKFSRTLGILISSGVPILQAMETVAKTAGNKIVEKEILNAKDSIREGEKISEPLKKSGIFPPMVIAMISVGEETGNLDTMLIKISDFYDQEVNNAVEAVTSMIEPLIIVVMGVVIGGIVVALFLPMFQMSSLTG
ncbi:type II secretion system F family protein [bacterium]